MFKRETRYVVLKISDIEKHLSEEGQRTLDAICAAISSGRVSDGKPLLEAVVVEHDWPEYEPTWAAIKARCDSCAV